MNIAVAEFRSGGPSTMAQPFVQLENESQPSQSMHGDTLLMRELTHRVANDWASAIATLTIAAKRTDNPQVKSLLGDVAGKFHGHVELFRALQVPERDTTIDAAEYLGRLCHSISRSKLDSLKIGLTFAADPLPIKAEYCWRLGMIVVELVTNSARHAFHGEDGALIRVDLSWRGPLAVCRVSDNGSGHAGARPGAGRNIVQELAKSIGGLLDQDFGSHGSTSILQFPI
jgi:two-component sensor histidine kinase